MPKKPAPQRAPIAVRLTEEMDKRFAKCAERTKQSKHALAIEAIEAAVEAIERNDYRLVVPIEFEVTHIPTPVGKPEALAARGERRVAPVGGRSSGSIAKRPLGYSINEPPASRTIEDPPDAGRKS